MGETEAPRRADEPAGRGLRVRMATAYQLGERPSVLAIENQIAVLVRFSDKATRRSERQPADRVSRSCRDRGGRCRDGRKIETTDTLVLSTLIALSCAWWFGRGRG